ncbi:MAG: hypothetical protein JWQ04_231 [Pedosphaera sp.]|nr:hypothetical protein [Pedosphaera sp.]
MANEPKREIERELRAAARQRREAAGEPRALNAAMRKVLQEEVARMNKETSNIEHPTSNIELGKAPLPGGSFWRRVLWGTWPRVALNVAVAGAMVLAGWVLLPMFSTAKKSRFELARNEYKFSSPAATPMAPPPATPPSQAKDKLEAAKKPAGTPQSLSSEMRLAGAKPRQAETLDDSRARALGLDNKTDTGLAANQTPPPPAVSASAAVQENLGRAGAAGGAIESGGTAPGGFVRQRFERVNPSMPALKAAKGLRDAGVMESFRLEQTGNQIRVTDSDGSIYTGLVEEPKDVANPPATIVGKKLVPSQSAATSDTADQELAKAAPKSSQSFGASGQFKARSAMATTPQSPAASVQLFFRVSGTNLSLHQELVFSGQLLTGAAPPATDAPASGIVRSPLPNAQVRGRVTLGKTNQMEINARAAAE